MGSRHGFWTLFLLLASSLITLAGEPPSIPYRLDADASFQEGCFGGCLCPVFLSGLEGGFRLAPAGSAGGFTLWTLQEIDWQIPETGNHYRGSGLLRVRPGIGGLQQLVLDLSRDGGPVEQYDSGIVPTSVRFPAIDVLASLYDLQCYDELFEVRARPAGPVTFRFEGVVESVFDGLGALGGQVEPGSTFRGVFTFDPDTPNSAPPFPEGELGLYHHDRPPAGVRLRLGHLTFVTVRPAPDFDVIVNNDIGFVGADEFGFVSRNNRARGLAPGAPIDRLELDWLASTFTSEPLDSAELPLFPPDLDLLGGGLLTIEGECTLCLGPAAFFRIEGTLTSLTRPLRFWVTAEELWWEGPTPASGHDLLLGDLDALRQSGGDVQSATRECLANDQPGAMLPFAAVPDPGESFWFVARPVNLEGDTYDSHGLAQLGDRDAGSESQPAGCP